MKSGYLFSSVLVLGLAYLANAHWSVFSHFHEQPKVKLIVENEIFKPAKLRPVQIERRLLNSTLHVMQTSHQIFAESWRLLVGTSSIPKSAMKALSTRLTEHLAEDPTTIAENPTCKVGASKGVDTLSFNLQSSGKNYLEFDLKHNHCLAQFTQPVAEVRWSNFEDPKAPAELRVIFHPNQLSDGVGDSLAALNAPIDCRYKIGEEDKVIQMSCQNLGQGLGRAEHFHFSQFEYYSDQKDLLIVEADHFKNLVEKQGCVSTKPCLSLRVPLQGLIHIVDDRRKGKAKVVAGPIPAPVQPPPIAATNNAEQHADSRDSQNQSENMNARMAGNAAANEVLNSNNNVDINNPEVSQKLQRQISGVNNDEKNQNQIQNQNQAQEGEPAQSQQPQVDDAAAQGLPPASQSGVVSPELQPAINSGEPALVQSREPSGKEASPVLLPEGQHSGLYR